MVGWSPKPLQDVDEILTTCNVFTNKNVTKHLHKYTRAPKFNSEFTPEKVTVGPQ